MMSYLIHNQKNREVNISTLYCVLGIPNILGMFKEKFSGFFFEIIHMYTYKGLIIKAAYFVKITDNGMRVYTSKSWQLRSQKLL